mmetsp:Transcript_16639/g.24909  ORF Transcript_16639/g.24909 Transcript_16639/m.24909 type:complete len:332 (+) Transcript_16639:116-1111(+)
MYQDDQAQLGFVPLNQKKKNACKRAAIFFFGIVCAYLIVYYETTVAVTSTDTTLEDTMHGLDPTKYHGRYPHSLLTLFYPYTLLRDVVLDQPIADTDIPFFWHLHNSDERVYKKILTSCYGLELIELDTVKAIEEAGKLGIIKKLDRYKHVITSPFVRETAEIFTTENFGRMIAFFRHPIDYDIHPDMEQFEATDNWLTRMLSNWPSKDITFKELGVAKHVVRQCCLMGTLDKMKTSIVRIAIHMNWKYANDMTDGLGEKCIDDALLDMPGEKWADHESDAWKSFYQQNRYDNELYELSQSTWRHQIQTIVPWEIQLSRAEDDDDEEEDEE